MTTRTLFWSALLASALTLSACTPSSEAGSAGEKGGVGGFAGSSAGAGSTGGSAGAGGSGGSSGHGGSAGGNGGQAGGAGDGGSGAVGGGGGQAGSGGQAGAGAGGTGGAGAAGGSGAAGGDAGGGGFGGVLVECAEPSIDRLKSWVASGEGTTVPPTGTLLMQDGAKYVAKVEFVGAEWHVIPVLVANMFESQADFSASSGFQLTYSATSDLYVQLRPASAWDGGAKYLTLIPSTGGTITTAVFSFAEASWTTLPELGTPDYPFAQALTEVRGLVFVGKTPNLIAFHGLRIDGYEPPCDAPLRGAARRR